MRKFVEIKVESDCCQKYGICGEQYVTDISFDRNGKVSATRFRFSHTPVRFQDDFIRDLILTRRVADLFSEKLIPNKPSLEKSSLTFPETKDMPLHHRIMQNLGLKQLASTGQEEVAPIAFTYSLFYVYYD